jgi:tetratricopeptide (TPR) repeat protein
VDGAIECYREATRVDPGYVLAHNNLGFSLNRKGDPDGAAASFREAVRLDPKFADPHYHLGRILQRQGRPVEALPFLRRGHDLGSRRPGWTYPSAKWLAECEKAAAELEARTAPPPRPVRRPPP